MSNNEPFYDTEFEDVRQWDSLLKHEYFNKVIEKIEADIKRIDYNIERLVEEPSMDNAIKVTSFAKSKESLQALISFFQHMKDKKLQLDKRAVERKSSFFRSNKGA